jgi:putative MATE family efflux protein
MSRQLDLTTASIPKCLLALAVPILGTNFLRTLFHLANGMWVGGLGSQALAAVSTSLFISWFFFSLNSIICSGTTTLIAQVVGAKREKEAVSISQQAVLLGLLFSLLQTILTILFSGTISKALGLEKEVVLLIVLYINTVAFFVIFISLAEIFGAILIGYGDTKTPSLIFSVGLVINIILDPLLIYGIGFPKLGLVGASWSTNVSFIITFLIFLFLIWKGKTQLKADFIKGLRIDWAIIKQIFKIGTPLSISFMLYSVIYIVLIKIIAYFGTAAVASLGIGRRVENVSLILLLAFKMAATTMVGQNIGAQKIKRAEESVVSSLKFVSVIGLAITVIFLLVPQQLVMIFNKEAEVIKIASSYICIVAFLQVFMAVTMVLEGAFAGVGNTVPPMVTSVIFMTARLPAAYFLAITLGWGINGVWWALTISRILEAMVLSYWFSKGKWKEYRVG